MLCAKLEVNAGIIKLTSKTIFNINNILHKKLILLLLSP